MPNDPFLESLRAEYQPASAMQELAVNQAARAATDLRLFNSEFDKCRHDLLREQPDMYKWSPAQFAVFDRMLRYRTQAERAHERAWKGVELMRTIHLKAQYREFWEKLQNSRLELAKQRLPAPKEKEKEAEKRAVSYSERPIHLLQTIQVAIKDGVVSHTVYPKVSDLQIRAAFSKPGAKVIRNFEFPDGVPAEYAWVKPDLRHDGYIHTQLFASVDEWRAHSALEEAAGPNCYLPKKPIL